MGLSKCLHPTVRRKTIAMSVVESLWNMGLHGYSVIPCVVFDLPAVLTYSAPEALIYCKSTACICYTPTGLTDSLTDSTGLPCPWTVSNLWTYYPPKYWFTVYQQYRPRTQQLVPVHQHCPHTLLTYSRQTYYIVHPQHVPML